MFGGSFYAHTNYSAQVLGGVFGFVIVVILIFWLLGGPGRF